MWLLVEDAELPVTANVKPMVKPTEAATAAHTRILGLETDLVVTRFIVVAPNASLGMLIRSQH
jgi:hypothetical protein